MSRLILTNKTTSEMNRIAPFIEIEFSDEDCLEGMLVTVTLRDGSRQDGLFTNLAFPIGSITIKERCGWVLSCSSAQRTNVFIEFTNPN